MCRDYKKGNRYFNVVFSGSCESAVQNSSLSETQRLSQEMNELHTTSPTARTFYYLDIIEDRSQPAGRDQPGDATPVNGAGGRVGQMTHRLATPGPPRTS